MVQPEVSFLGHVVGQEGVRPNPKLVEKVQKWEAPKNVKEVQQFAGLCNYYRRFVHKHSDIMEPIVKLTRKDVAFQWTIDGIQLFLVDT